MKLFTSPNFKPVSKQMFQIAVPIAISGLVMQAQSLIDTAFLARYSMNMPDGTILSGSDILSAVGNVFFPYLVGLSFIWSLVIGIVVLVSQRLGAGEPGKARQYALAGIKYTGLLTLLIYGFWFLFAKNIFILLGVRQPILTLSLDYIRFVSLELLYLGITTSIGAVFQGAGNTRPEMVTGVLRSLLHIFLDYLFIFGNFGLPEMGVAGAGLASSLSGLTAALVLVVIFFTSKKLPFKVDLKSILAAPLREYIVVLKVGLPSGLEDMLWNLGNLVLAYFLNLLSMEAVGIYRLVYQIELTPIYFYMGLARAVVTLVGNRTGERNLSGAREVGLIGSFYTVSFCLLFSAAFLSIPQFILLIFTPDTALIKTAAPLLMITGITMIPRAINIISGHGIRGYGDTLWMLVTQVFGIVFIISLSYALMFPLGFGMYGLFIGMFSDESVRSIINTIRFYRGETSLFHKAPIVEGSIVETMV